MVKDLELETCQMNSLRMRSDRTKASLNYRRLIIPGDEIIVFGLPAEPPRRKDLFLLMREKLFKLSWSVPQKGLIPAVPFGDTV